MNSDDKDKYSFLVKKLTELRNLIKYMSNYDYSKLGEVIEILSDKEKNKNEDMMNNVRKYLSKDNFFNVRWAYDWFMPKINGENWFDYIYGIEKICDETLHNITEKATDK